VSLHGAAVEMAKFRLRIGKSKTKSRFPEGMTERKPRATTEENVFQKEKQGQRHLAATGLGEF
jgi:hypothetical protein